MVTEIRWWSIKIYH